jgi:phospho-N-acetylmuramoyl-pentapeptide-transferase
VRREENLVDAKASSSRSLNISGVQLLFGLATALLLFALFVDLSLGQVGQPLSLTLPFLACASVVAGVGFWAVPMLRALKLGQIIREDGPKTHLKKAGTPTMGGIFFLPVALLVAVLWSGFSPNVLAVSALTLAYGWIGWVDDWAIIRGGSNKGMTPRIKLALQVGFAALFCLWLAFTYGNRLTTIALPFGLLLPLGFLFWALAVFTLTAESNAVNLTDGVDGLAGGTVAIALLGLGAIVAPTHPDIMLFCACLSGSCVGFLVHNRNPAQVFMGNTGSTALGGALGAVALVAGVLFPLLVVSLLFLVETVSVIIQVSYYKATKGANGVGKRFFKMSPYHNHLELSGWAETQIVGAFYLLNILLVFVALTLR